MNTTSKLLDYTTFIVFRDCELSSVAQKVLTHLYMPLIGPKSINIYTTLSTFLSIGENESLPIGHLKLFQMLQINKEQSFIEERNKLEAVGLLDVYTSNDNYIYRLNLPSSPNEFFNNEFLSQFLWQMVGPETYQNLLVEFLMHRFDLTSYQRITKSFDEVFMINSDQTINYTNELNSLITTKSGMQIKVNNPHFDYQYLMILLGALDIIDSAIINSREFYDFINRYSFIFQLSTEEIKDAVIASAMPNGTVDYDELKKMCKRFYENRPTKGKIVQNKQSTSNDKLIMHLESTAPTEIVKTMFGVGLVASEIEMFDSLMYNTGITLGILNVLIIYVLKDKNGEIPSYNYFDKIIKTWQRMGIDSTLAAMDYINGRNQKVNKTTKRGAKPVPDWYDDYAKDLETKELNNKSSLNDDETLKEINELFKFEER